MNCVRCMITNRALSTAQHYFEYSKAHDISASDQWVARDVHVTIDRSRWWFLPLVLVSSTIEKENRYVANERCDFLIRSTRNKERRLHLNGFPITQVLISSIRNIGNRHLTNENLDLDRSILFASQWHAQHWVMRTSINLTSIGKMSPSLINT